MRMNRRERGEGKLGCLIGLILLGLAIFVASKVIPLKMKAAELRETIVDETHSAGSHNDDRIRAAILAKAREDSLPVTEKDIQITRSTGTNAEIVVTVTYMIPIVFPGYTYNWHPDPEVKAPIVIF